MKNEKLAMELLKLAKSMVASEFFDSEIASYLSKIDKRIKKLREDGQKDKNDKKINDLEWTELRQKLSAVDNAFRDLVSECRE